MDINIKKKTIEELSELRHLIGWIKHELDRGEATSILDLGPEKIFRAVALLGWLKEEDIIMFGEPEEYQKKINCPAYIVDVSVTDPIKFERFRLEIETELHFRKTKHRIGNKKDGHKISPLEVPEGTTWGDIRMTFISEDVDVANLVIKGKRFPGTFARMGFMDNRAGKYPDKSWELLRLFGRHNGTIAWKDGVFPKDKNLAKKKISELRKKLIECFQIQGKSLQDNPLKYDDKHGEYRTEFHVSWQSEDVEQEEDDSFFDETPERSPRFYKYKKAKHPGEQSSSSKE